MKNSDEMVASLFERREQYVIEQKRKRKFFAYIATPMFCVFLMALLGFGMLQGDFFYKRNPPVNQSGKGDEILIELNKGSSSDDSNYIVIWAEGGSENSAIMEVNGKNISIGLSDALKNAPKSSKVAIIARPTVIDQSFIYKGKSIADYQDEAETKQEAYEKLAMLLKNGDSLKYGEALYKTGTSEGEKWSQSLYEETVETIGEELLSKYIVNGMFLKAELEADMAAVQETIKSKSNYDFACAAYRYQAVSEVMEELDVQGIDYNKTNYADCDYIIIYASEEEFSTLSFEGISNWCFDFASKNKDKGQDFLAAEEEKDTHMVLDTSN